ncbi:hypothetical protein IAQ61_010783 [Plenodomus lingam]|uniref:uncharacterized protein n=1 Tax=Leptosphaeria maculans TaxID=5022 RepID=UPI003327DE08|nr:hypothetical protein IAQ61_010783 [Plenodomus lingam]
MTQGVPPTGCDPLTQPPEYKTFRHHPLDRTKQSIRLIRILPKLSSSGEIQCILSHASVRATYTCLSYRWGDTGTLQDIVINGRRFAIRQNLFDFLQVVHDRLQSHERFEARQSDHLNHDTGKRKQTEETITSIKKSGMTRGEAFLNGSISRRFKSADIYDISDPYWIDAVCIDQNNIEEKNHQVDQMGLIYSNATAVDIWLGRTPPCLFPLVSVLGRAENVAPDEATMPLENNMSLIQEYIIHNPYWSRAWVTQEIMLARRVSVRLNAESIGFIDMIRGIERLGFPGRHEAILKSQFAQIARRWRKKSKAKSLINLLADFHGKGCEDPRDRVFSLRTLCPDAPEVDYHLTRNELAIQVLSGDGERLCICSAVVVAQALGLQHYECQSASSGHQLPYLEFDVVTDRSIPGSAQRHLYSSERSEPRVIGPSGQSLNFHHTCDSASLRGLQIWWNPRGPSRLLESFVYKHSTYPFQHYGDGLKHVDDNGGSGCASKARISLKVLAKMVTDPVELCSHAILGRTRDSCLLTSYPRIYGLDREGICIQGLPPIRTKCSTTSKQCPPSSLKRKADPGAHGQAAKKRRACLAPQ